MEPIGTYTTARPVSLPEDTQGATLSEMEAAKNTLLNTLAKQAGFDASKTRKHHAFTTKQTLTVKEIKQVIRGMKIDLNTVTPAEIEQIIGKPDMISQTKAISNLSGVVTLYHATQSKSLENVVKAVIHLDRTQRATILEHEANGEHVETPRTLELESEAFRAFGLDVDDAIITIEVDPSHFKNADFEGNIGEYRHGVKVRNYNAENKQGPSKDSHLCVNNETIRTMKIHVPAYYCKMCKTSSGSNQVRHAQGCPKCGAGREYLTGQSVNIQLPLIRFGGLVTSTIGKVDFRTLRLNGTTKNAIIDANNGIGSSAYAIQCLMNEPVKIRFNYLGRTTWVRATVKPVVFDVSGLDKPYIGLGVSLTEKQFIAV